MTSYNIYIYIRCVKSFEPSRPWDQGVGSLGFNFLLVGTPVLSGLRNVWFLLWHVLGGKASE